MDALVRAIANIDMDEIRRILALPNAREIVNQTDKDIYNSLFHATIKIQNEETALTVINMLIEKGADPLLKEENKQTILFYLAKEGKAKIIQRLLASFKYDLNEVDKYNQNPLYWAARFGRLKVAEILIRYGVNINHLDDYGETCLFFAATEGHLEMCKFLINRGCQHDLVDKLKKTPLHFARDNKRVAVIEYLVGLKEQNKKMKAIESKSQGPDKKDKKKKEVIRNEYYLVYTNEDGHVHQMRMSELEQFRRMNENNAKLYEYMSNPDSLQNSENRHQKRFIKIGTKIINQYLKRQDLLIFHEPVDTNLYPDYLQHVHRPIDFSVIKNKLMFNCYESQQEFKNDVIQVYDNCIRYNGHDSNLGRMSNQLKLQFTQTYRKQAFVL